MMNYTIAQTLTIEQFKHRFGVQKDTFQLMVHTLKPDWRAVPKPGAKPKLGLEDRVLVALEYWREYRTYSHIGSSWGVSEATVCRIVHWVENTLIRSGRFHLPGKRRNEKALWYCLLFNFLGDRLQCFITPGNPILLIANSATNDQMHIEILQFQRIKMLGEMFI
jgi:Helix-turn-helix of DDE superfamily endonuclease